LQIYGKSDIGKVRTVNQDSFAIEMFSEKRGFAIVCDGMGGANAGNIASEMAVKTISDYLKRSIKPNMTSSQVENILRSAVYSANTSVYEKSKTNPDYSGMGTTVVLLYFDNAVAYILHIGDSRAYLLHENSLTQLTVDHSMVQTMIEKGEITVDEAKVHPNKNIITRALGVGSEVNGDLDFADINEDDVFLLCSDGLSNFVSSEDIIEQLTEFNLSVADRLIDIANENGGKDNITAVAVKF